MSNALKVLITTIFFPVLAFALPLGSFNYESAFNFVEEDMPEAFEVGQSVLFELEVDLSVAGFSDAALFSYPDAISELIMEVPEAAFSVTLTSGSLFLDPDNKEVTASLSGDGEVFQGQELISIDLVLSWIDRSTPFDEFSNSSAFFDESVVSRWAINFASENGTSSTSNFATIWTTSGVETGAIPEPNAYSLLIGIAVIALTASIRRRG